MTQCRFRIPGELHPYLIERDSSGAPAAVDAGGHVTGVCGRACVDALWRGGRGAGGAYRTGADAARASGPTVPRQRAAFKPIDCDYYVNYRMIWFE